jgi:uncharacterized SAM-binding protein YcdF (DUF218 family)
VARRVLIVLAVLVGAWLIACAVLFVWPPAETGAPARANAVVVLSGAKNRLAKGEQLIRDGVAPVLAISSVHRTPNWHAAIRLCRAGVYHRARVLCFEANPYSTRGEAETVSRIARRHRWSSLAIVSSTFHLTRAKLLFRRCFGGKLSLVGTSTPWWQLPQEWASETAKLTDQLLFQRSC